MIWELCALRRSIHFKSNNVIFWSETVVQKGQLSGKERSATIAMIDVNKCIRWCLGEYHGKGGRAGELRRLRRLQLYENRNMKRTSPPLRVGG